ncbi:MAG: hypothetical protein MUF27_01695 [Acidobacteria bacterium]|nr:hypothetical protein [Acidobacteriota bacterium]
MRAGGRAAAAVAERIVNCLPAASVEMETFCRLASIELVDDGEAGAPGARGPAVRTTPAVRTAAVECADRPRLLLNARFLREYCRRDEHLFLLVMHELWHVILGHTRLYPRIDLADEIAFDAVINAGLARQFRGPEYLGFFDRLNPADSFPALLLRPPAGWPDDPVYPGLGPAGTLRVLRQLYPPPDYPPTVSIPSHAELVALIAAGPRGRKRCEPLLLGDHETGPAGGGSLDPGAAPTRAQRALADPLLADVLRRSVAHWPEPPFVLGNPGRGGFPSAHDVLPAPAAEAARRVFARLLRRCLVEGPSRERRRTRVPTRATGWPPRAAASACRRRSTRSPRSPGPWRASRTGSRTSTSTSRARWRRCCRAWSACSARTRWPAARRSSSSRPPSGRCPPPSCAAARSARPAARPSTRCCSTRSTRRACAGSWS